MTTPSVVLITGSSNGLGRLAAETLARQGHTVFASMRDPHGRNAAKSAELRALAQRERLALHVIDLDVTNDASVDQAVASILDHVDQIDVLINNAAVMYAGITEAYSISQVRQQMETNFFGVIRTTRAVLPGMRRRGSGLLIHISSLAGRIIVPFFALYNSSKFALEALAESYRYELSTLGIESIIVEPGPFPTGLIGSNAAEEDHARLSAYGELAAIPQAILNGFQASFALPDAPQPQEVADALARLIALPAGKRPLRTIVGADYGLTQLNELADQRQQGLMKGMGLEHLMHIAAAEQAV